MTWRSICPREKGRTVILCPASGSPGLCCEQQGLSLSVISPLQAGLGSWMQRGRGRDMGYRAKATMFPLKLELAHFLPRL